MASHDQEALHVESGLSAARRAGDAAAAGHTGDLESARRGLSDSHEMVRATALAALVRLGEAKAADLERALSDRAPSVRRRAAELAHLVHESAPCLLAALDDEADVVVEAACFSLGELRAPGATQALVRIAESHRDPLCREAAVASLGAIGDRGGLPAILRALKGPPALRRRAVVALAAHTGPEVDAGLERALADKDWQVRQAAEDLTGRPRR